MTQTVKDANQQKATGPAAVIEQYRGDLSIVLPSHLTANADTWVRVAMGAIRKNADLFTACQTNPNSMMAALMEAARLGLEPGTDEYHLTPRKNKSGKWEVLGIVGYQGEVELIYRAGAAASVHVELVRERDEFLWTPGAFDTESNPPRWVGPQTRPYHKVDWFGDRGAVKGSYAYAVMKDTGAISKVVVVGEERIQRAIEASPTAKASHSPWKSDYGAMVLKTAAHDLSKWVPTSAEYRREQLRDAAAVQRGTADPAQLPPTAAPTAPPPAPAGFIPPPADYIDGEVVPTDDTAEPEPESEPQPPVEDDRPAEKRDKNRLFALLRDGSVTSTDRAVRLRIVNRILNRVPKLTSFDELTTAEAATVNAFMQRHKEIGDLAHTLAELGAAPPAEQPPDDTPAEQPEQKPAADTEGDRGDA